MRVVCIQLPQIMFGLHSATGYHVWYENGVHSAIFEIVGLHSAFDSCGLWSHTLQFPFVPRAQLFFFL